MPQDDAVLCASDKGLVRVGKEGTWWYLKGWKVMVVSRVDGRRYLVGVVGDGRNEVVLWNYQADSIEKRLEVDRFTYFSSLQKLYVSDR